MTSEERLGKTISWIIAGGLLALNAFVALARLLMGGRLSTGNFIQIGVMLVMAVCLAKGIGWARAYLAVSMALTAFFSAIWPFRAGQPSLAIFALPQAALFLAAAIILWKSAGVEAYFDRQTRLRDAPPSMRDALDS